ncbi:nitrilase-related carbon-nitrogen hydrolase [Salinibacterium sp. G-O1]|uniref:nitrilase-related carbon-nitrogen hydrolase n=1 Tax=Salinibacterium sp. G-O1 TaxID=3046208 RepID=UPI0024BB1C24|nr:nitrilase-related carbon-nitrogen hydrolase [Salinibacterium sp. G-O1]MDJ0333835.1 nitrilase-related carbon-nitrogen hydrolase [Salinibacterium sp. G-O1]
MDGERIHTIAVAQGAAIIDDVDQNLATLRRLASRAQAEGADVVVTPELFATGYAPDRAWKHDGVEIRAALSQIARDLNIALVASTIDTVAASPGGAGARHHVAASFMDNSGTETARVHKRHLFGGEEQLWLTAAENYGESWEWRDARWGMGICYDVEFPEFARALARGGVDVMLVPTAVPQSEQGIEGMGEAWHYSATQTSMLQVPARALENGVVIAYANHCGPGFTGHSCIATPFGRHAALLDDREGVAVVTVPIDAIHASRRVNTYLNDLDRAFPPAQPKELP